MGLEVGKGRIADFVTASVAEIDEARVERCQCIEQFNRERGRACSVEGAAGGQRSRCVQPDPGTDPSDCVGLGADREVLPLVNERL